MFQRLSIAFRNMIGPNDKESRLRYLRDY